MLHFKDWQDSQKGVYTLIALLSLVLVTIACRDGKAYTDKEITMQAFSDMKAPVFVLDFKAIADHLHNIAASEQPQTESDRHTRRFYLNADHLLWVDQSGVDHRADSLLSWLQTVGDMGMSERAFYVGDIECDLNSMRTLDFTPNNDINRVAARLEYHLTKAYMRYSYGLRYGFVNPHRLFNNLDVEKEDSLHHTIRYRGLFDIDIEHPDAIYDSLVFSKIERGDVATHLRQIQSTDKLYGELKRMLLNAQTDEERQRIICNMERSRWRLKRPIPEEGKYIVVNIPAFHLYAYGEDTLLHMRIACGAVTTKTPQLTSEMEWMEINPQWVIPMSIIEKDVAPHVGDSVYFARNRYKVYDKTTNQQIDPQSVSRAMLLSGQYRVAQQSGSDNSLGRIVFRFKNPYAVYLHYTSSPGVFQRAVRAVSHGCVRVEHPFELAHFVLNNPDEWLLDRIRISMDLSPWTERGRQYLRSHSNDKEHKLVGYVPVKPHIPLYIIYNTIWPDETGELRTWPDIYGYDTVLWNSLKVYM